MNQETVLTVICSIFAIGVTYGTLHNRIKQLETKLTDWKGIETKIAKIEVQIDFIVEKLKN